jgi:hypothetical protein
MAKTNYLPKKGVVYECYMGFTDDYGDRARKGQKFVFEYFDDDEICMSKASGRGMSMMIAKDKFAAHFCPAATPEKEDVAPETAESPFTVKAELLEGSWEDVKESLDELPEFIQELLKRAKPELFEAPKPKVFEFKRNGNGFGTVGGNTPFYVGKGLVKDEDAMKCLIVERKWKAELFEGPNGHQCIRFVEK